MTNIDSVLNNHEQLQILLNKVPVNVLADAIAIRQNVVALRQDGMHVLMIPNK